MAKTKKRKTNAKSSTNRNSKKKTSKGKRGALLSNRRRSSRNAPAKRSTPKGKAGKKRVAKRPISKTLQNRKILRARKKYRVRVDSKYWKSTKSLKREKSASYSTRILRSPRSEVEFRIKKKIKKLKNAQVDKTTFTKIAKSAARYHGIGKKPLKSPKSVVMKIAYKTKKSKELKFSSSYRTDISNREELADLVKYMFNTMRAYGDVEIVGYEFEETI